MQINGKRSIYFKFSSFKALTDVNSNEVNIRGLEIHFSENPDYKSD